MQQLQNEQQPLQKVTKSLYIVTHLGQLPFILFTQMARTWALKEDSVNTTIIHWYSTVRPHQFLETPRNAIKASCIWYVEIQWPKRQKLYLACQLGKQHRFPLPNERNRSNNKLDLIHSDVWGLVYNVSFGGGRYFVSFINDFSKHTWIFEIEKKSKVFSCFLKLKSLIERETDRKIKRLRSDGVEVLLWQIRGNPKGIFL